MANTNSSDLPSNNQNLRERFYNEKTPTEINKEAPILEIASNPHGYYEIYNMFLLTMLYLLQGIPTGLALGSLPFLLKSKLSYSQLALFSLSGYPYSLKLFWSPIVDLIYLKKFGRRKSWIVPLQLIISVLLYWLGKHMDVFFENENGNNNLYTLTCIFFTLVFLAATQDIAVDGWALTLLSKENVSYASTCQTIGLNTGYFLSFTILLALISPEFCNQYLRKTPETKGLITLGSYMTFWAFMYVFITFITILKKENKTQDTNVVEEEFTTIKEGYLNIYHIAKLKHMQSLMLVLFVCKIGFMANDSITGLKLLELGLKKEDLALSVLIDFPFQIIFGYLAAKWSTGKRPLKPWLFAFYLRLLLCFLAIFVVYYFPRETIKEKGNVGSQFMAFIITSIVLTSFTSTVMFVSISAFFSKIADPKIGGTYMTLLNTLSNFGGTWPKFFILELVDYFTVSKCEIATENNKTLIEDTVNCIKQIGKDKCKDLGGQCVTTKDGYYTVSILCISLGIIFLFGLIKSRITQLEKLPKDVWKLKRN